MAQGLQDHPTHTHHNSNAIVKTTLHKCCSTQQLLNAQSSQPALPNACFANACVGLPLTAGVRDAYIPVPGNRANKFAVRSCRAALGLRQAPKRKLQLECTSSELIKRKHLQWSIIELLCDTRLASASREVRVRKLQLECAKQELRRASSRRKAMTGTSSRKKGVACGCTCCLQGCGLRSQPKKICTQM